MKIDLAFYTPMTKVWFTQKKLFKIKTENNTITSINLQHMNDDIRYIPNNKLGLGIEDIIYFSERDELSILNRGDTFLSQVSPSGDGDFTFPAYLYLGEGETETDEPATETIIFPPPETPLQFLERIGARLFHVTQRIAVLRHEEPHQNALSEDICREVPEDHDEVLRYDISNNLIKRPVGWIALQIENYESKYQRHLAAVEAAQKANRAVPNFNDDRDRTSIETLLEKVEEHITETCLRDHFDLHQTSDWNPVQNVQRKITLCNDDANRTPGEVLVDVNAFFTDGRGRIAQEHAKKTYHEISTKYWVKAKRTSHRELVTERIVEV